ncbi:hypothetical protein PBOR_21795 [Paenibacillus borealis]|uniref:Uncharacterized protein n=1 Tax=Paenibacillus borealis TaxID=160799 RepID=A0A089LJF3_PAEBO|nr:hypothetical protein PBOR_21795 [Paenibacillus borealis]
MVVSVIAIATTTVVWEGFKPVQEYKDVVRFVFQDIYYLFEAALILLTIAFGQKFGETLFKRGGLPYGGDVPCTHMGPNPYSPPRRLDGCLCVLHVSFIRNYIHNVEKKCAVFVCSDCGCVYSVR